MKKASKTLAVLLSVLLLFSFGTTVFADETTVPVGDPTPEVTSSPEPSTEPEPSETPEASPSESPAPETPEEESSAPEISSSDIGNTETSEEISAPESVDEPSAGKTPLAKTTDADSIVAKIGETPYTSLQDAFNYAQDGDVITLTRSFSITEGNGPTKQNGVDYSGGKSFVLDFASHEVTSDLGNAVFCLRNGSITLKNGTITAGGNTYCTIIATTDVSVDTENMTLNNSKQYGMSVKAFEGATVNLTNTTFNSSNGAGGAVAAGGTINVVGSGNKFIQTGYYDHNSSCVAASNSGTLNVQGGTFTSETGYGVYVFNSGATININGGDFTAAASDKSVIKADKSTTSTPSAIHISNGNITGNLSIANGADLVLTGGTYSTDVSQYVPDGYTTTGSDGSFTITDATEPTEDSVAETGGIYYKSVQNAINAAEGGATVTLVKSVNEDIVVSGKEITLDLGENTLTNVSGDTITVKIDANLTVVGSGTVDNKSNARAAIFNEGTVTLNGGTYDRTSESGESADISGGNSWYTICNHGSMTIHDGATVKNTGSFSSMIENGYYSYKSGDARTGYISGANAANPTLVIEGGEFVGGLNTVKNDDGGKLYIHGGSFSNSAQAAVLNWNVTEITGGNFEVTTKYAVVLNGKDTGNTNNGEVLNQGNLSITGGSFTAPKGTPVIEGMKTNTDMSDVKVSGGTFSSNVGAFVVKGAEVYEDENGNFGIRPAQGSAVAINGVGYTTMQDAVNAIATSESKTGTITVLKDIPDATGVKVPEGLNLTIDFADHTYTLSGPGAGSTNTETNGFQLLKDSNIVFKNGTINIAENAKSIKRMVQNYANLTLEDMRFEAANQVDGENYALSFNNGDIVFKGNTSIITTSDDTIAFDVCKFSNYEGVNVTFSDSYTGEINGRIVYDSPDSSNWSLTVNGNGKFGGIDLSATATAEPNISVTGGTFESDPMAYVADSSSAVRYTSNGQSHFAVGAASIRDTAAQAADDSAIDVLQGDVSVDIKADNVTVSNSGKGTVSVNKTPVESGSSMEVHRLEKVEAKAATCKEEGHKAYYKCADCGELFEDANGTIPTTAAAVTIPKTEHSFGEWEVTKPATTTEKGEKQRTCSICGLVETAEIPLLDKPDPDPSTEPSAAPSTEPTAAPSTAPTAAPSAAPTEKPATSGPQTGDEGVSAVWIALLAISGCAVTLLSVKRRKS